ncbi:MAG: 50S ribosomal protein L4 [Planctomycetota bacterium]|nr:50S ribosomal protein L4 [Planctomycetota bacterium]
MDVPVYNMQGTQVASLTIDEHTLGGEVNAALIKQAYVMYHANLRQGSSRTKNRHEVEGSTRKLYKQKGTGNARHGDKKANLFKGGGHGHSKKRTREDFRVDMPKKMRRKANRNALLAKLVDQEVRVIDSLQFGEPRTRAFKDFLGAIKVDNTAVVALSSDEARVKNTRLSGRNIDGVRMIRSDQLTAYEMLGHRYVVIERAELEAWLHGPTSQTGKDAKVSPLGREAGAEGGRAKSEVKS